MEMSKPRYLLLFALILLAGTTLRAVWLRADPPTVSVGIVWHDEGAWVHNARNQALWGVWQTDRWNPVYVAPVFTGLEYVAFATLGVGTWQARTVPVASGVLSLLAIMMGLSALWGSRDPAIGRRVALLGGAVLAFNFTWVMWNRAALMESTMTAFIVMAWAAYAMGERKPAWGLVAGIATSLAFFTKASAAFFAAAVVLDALWVITTDRVVSLRKNLGLTPAEESQVRTAWLTLAGLAVTSAFAVLYFVFPYWDQYHFYNWQMSVTRKPSYDLRSLIDRASWLPLVQDFFARMWIVLLGACVAIVGIVARWRESKPGERLLVLWVLLGLFELVVHDAGNERRYVMFIPALAALAAGLGGSGIVWLPAHFARPSWKQRLLAAPLVALLAYLVFGSGLRWLFVDQIQAHDFKLTVRIAAGLALALTAGVWAFWPQITSWFGTRRVPFGLAVVLATLLITWNLGQYTRWSVSRSELNYRASVALGAVLPPETLVQGKLANGMALENRIRPIFVGNGFGNYEDRFDRDDARYILTYGLPSVGFESQRESGLIQEILDHYPNRRIIEKFEIDETPGPDQAWLIDKAPARISAAAAGSNRAPD
jgi:4-amino-4-deoxy-L-arabinose transferase-like glycosyltransferase